MTEVILNDECMRCQTKECHDGEHFCNQAMKDNSFYKNAKLYKGLEVIQRPTYADLEKEIAELKADNDARKFAMAMSEKVEKQLREEIAELRTRLEALEGQTPWKDIKDKSELIGKLTKAKELLAKWVELYKPKLEGYPITPIQEQTEQFLNSEVEK